MSRPVAFHASIDRYTGWSLIGRAGPLMSTGSPTGISASTLPSRSSSPNSAPIPAQIDAMRREVLISRALRHPNICPIHDLYEGPQGVGVIMDLLDGIDLKQWIAANRGQLLDTLADRLTVFRAVSDALALGPPPHRAP